METDKEIVLFIFRFIKTILSNNATKQDIFIFTCVCIISISIIFLFFWKKWKKKRNNEIESEHYTTLMRLVAEEKVDEIQTEVVKNKANIDFALENGTTALMVATKLNKVNSLVCLIQLNANVHLKDKNGNSAYDIAISDGNTVIAEILRQLI